MKLAQWALAILLFVPVFVFAEPVAVAEKADAKVTLFDDKCTLEEVVNLPFHAEWAERDKTFAGCWILTRFDIVIAYFSDKTVVLIPPGILKKVIGI